MNWLKIFFFCTIFAINAALPATGLSAIYYLDAVNGNDSNPGTSEQPWATMDKAKSYANPGDTILLKNGNYGAVSFTSGDSTGTGWADNEKIVYKAFDGQSPVFDKLDIVGVGNGYMIFDKLRIVAPDNSYYTDSYDGVVRINNSSYIKVINCTVKGRYVRDGSGGLSKNGVIIRDGNLHDVLIEGCDISGSYYGLRVNGDIWGNIIIKDNHIHRVTGSILIVSTNLVENGEFLIEGNHLHDRRKDLDGAADGSHGAALYIGASHLRIRNNIIHDFGGSGSICGFGTFTPDGGYKDVIVENNLIYDAQGATNMRFEGLANDIIFRNNTLIGWAETSASGEYEHGSVGRIWPFGSQGVPNLSIYNNIFVGNLGFGSAQYNLNLNDYTEDNNIFWAVENDYAGTWFSNAPGGGNSTVIHNGSVYNPGYDAGYFEGSGNFFVGGPYFDAYSYRHPMGNNYSIISIDPAQNTLGVASLGNLYSDFSDIFMDVSFNGKSIDTTFTITGSSVGLDDGVWGVRSPATYDENTGITTIYVDGDIKGSVPQGIINCFDPYMRYANLYYYSDPEFGPGSHKQILNDAYKLADGSDAIGFANLVHVPATDLLGNPRDTSPDAGCYEYISGPADTTAPSIPQNLTAQVVSESQIDLSWNASSDPESGVSYYNIYRDGSSTPITTSVLTTYSDKGLSLGTTYSYQVSAVNGAGLESGRSSLVEAETYSDTTPPAIISVTVQSQVHILFSEPLDKATAETVSNYSISPGINISSATLQEDLRTVILVTSEHSENSQYTLTVNGVKDLAGNPMIDATYTYQYNTGLVGHWKFDEGTGATAQDSSNSENAGTLINGPAWTDGKIDGALNFDGVDDYVTCGNGTSLNLTGSLTISAWINPQSFGQGGWGRIVDKGNGSTGYSMLIESSSNRLGYAVYGSYVAYSSANIIELNTWQHVTVVYDEPSDSVAFYIDGQPAGTADYSTSPVDSANDPLVIGIRGYDLNRAFDGTIDQVRIYNRALAADEVLALFDIDLEPVIDISNGLVNYWKFDEGTGATAQNSSNSENAGTLINGPTWTNGKIDGALNFDGVDDYVTCGDGTSLNLTGNLTISAWINPQSFGQGGWGRIVDKGNGSTGYSMLIESSNNRLGYVVYGSYVAYSSANIIELNTWQHVTVVYDESSDSVAFYIDGQPAGTTGYSTPPLDSANDPLVIGIRGYDSNRAFDGTIDEVRIYNQALTADEVLALFNVDLEPVIDISNGLVNYWKFDEVNSNSIPDSSGSNNNAFLINEVQPTNEGEVDFNNIYDAVEIGTDDFNLTQGTIALWAKGANFEGVRYLFGHTVGSWSNMIQLYVNEGELCLGLGDSHTVKTGIQTLAPQIWYHIILMWNEKYYIVWVDGVARAGGIYTGLTTLNTLADIGNTGNTYLRNQAFNGIIDEVRIYNRLLTIDEISNLALVFLPIGDKTVQEGANLNFQLRAKAPDIVVEINDHNLPSEPELFSNSFNWTPAYGDEGSYEVTFEAAYDWFIDSETITIKVDDVQQPYDFEDLVAIMLLLYEYQNTQPESHYKICPVPEGFEHLDVTGDNCISTADTSAIVEYLNYVSPNSPLP